MPTTWARRDPTCITNKMNTSRLASRQRPGGILLRIKVFHEYIQKAMTPLASEDTIVTTALHNGSVTEQHTSEFSQ